MEFVRSNHDVFVGIERRLRGDEPSEMRNKESKRYTIAADDARGTKEGEDVGMQISGGISLLLQVTSLLRHRSMVAKLTAWKKMKAELPKRGSNATREYLSLPCISGIQKAGSCAMKN